MSTPVPHSDDVPYGRIDIHSHLIPGIDDGCPDAQDSLDCVRKLMSNGYVGTVCTPHIWPGVYDYTPSEVRVFIAQLRQTLADAGLDYRVWPGGEFRMCVEAIEYLETHGVPTLADSNLVLVDHWGDTWPKWINSTLEYLLEHGYQPVLAHPERINMPGKLDQHLKQIERMGVWLQGNFRCLTAAEGSFACRFARQLIEEERYHFVALDMHECRSLDQRLDGLHLLGEEYGDDLLDAYTIDAPRRLVFGLPAPQREPERRGGR